MNDHASASGEGLRCFRPRIVEGFPARSGRGRRDSEGLDWRRSGFELGLAAVVRPTSCAVVFAGSAIESSRTSIRAARGALGLFAAAGAKDLQTSKSYSPPK